MKRTGAQRVGVHRDVTRVEARLSERTAHHLLAGVFVTKQRRGGDEAAQELLHRVFLGRDGVRDLAIRDIDVAWPRHPLGNLAGCGDHRRRHLLQLPCRLLERDVDDPVPVQRCHASEAALVDEVAAVSPNRVARTRSRAVGVPPRCT